MYSYGTPGNITKKRLRVKRGALPNMDLDSTYSYDNEGRNTSMQYPSTWNGSSWTAGPNIGVEFNANGQLKKLRNLTTSTDIISAATYNAMGELLTMTGAGGAPSETRSYNGLGQMVQLQTGALNLKYNFHATQNNGKITSEEVVSGEIVTYTYDSLNRLATATSSDNPGWGQSFAYDGFGNLTTVATTKGSAPNLSVSYSASTNRRTSDTADANGNILQNGVTSYDVENRITTANITNGTVRYSYAPGNKRIWRGTWVSSSQTVDELTFYSAGGAKLCAYNLSTSGGNLVATGTGYYEYFGGKMIKNAGGYVGTDRLGSIGKFFPYGQERPSATSNGKEKFATYFRDAETGLDYAVNRYHTSGDGRFLTPDPYGGSASLSDPGSWNRYSYVGGDPINRGDPAGLCDVIIGGITQSGNAAFASLAGNTGAIQAYPYAGGSMLGGALDVAGPADLQAVQTVIEAITAAGQDPGPINIVAYSGGADAFKQALDSLPDSITSRIASVIYFSPGTTGDLAYPGTSSATYWGGDTTSAAAESGVKHSGGFLSGCDHINTACFVSLASGQLGARASNKCSAPAVYSRSTEPSTITRRSRGNPIQRKLAPPTVITPGFGSYWSPGFASGTGGSSSGSGYYDLWASQNAGYSSAYFGYQAWMAPYLSVLGGADSYISYDLSGY